MFITGAALLIGDPVLAQSPERIAATFGDWTVVCVMPSQAQKSCEIAQTQTDPAQSNPVGHTTIARPAKSGAYSIVFQVQANVWIDGGLKLIVDDKDAGLTGRFRWCISTRCTATAELPESVLKNLRSRTEPGKVQFQDAVQHDVYIPISFKGLSQALDYLEKQ